MEAGTRIADRFELKSLAGKGGMGEVWRAYDKHQRTDVAVKVLRIQGLASERFVREAQVLSTLDHPHVVRYVAHGATEDGQLYLAMEWLEGEDLGQRLARGALGYDESMSFGKRVASALSAAHELGIVHRDLKPENLFLVGGAPNEVRVLDFGIARVLEATRALTSTGVLVGTPGYTSPEQARGDKEIGPASDVFALGCVLFECVTGRQAFSGEHLVAILAKLLLADPPRASAFRTDVPSELDALLLRMLAKDPLDRPKDASAVGEELDAIRRETGSTSDMPPASRSFTPSERRVVSVILAGMPDPASAETMLSGESEERLRVIREVARTREVRLESLADGTSVLVLEGGGEAMDRVERAAAVALAVRDAAPETPVSLATGWTRAGAGLPVGEVIDRAVRLLATAAEGFDRRGIAVDAATARLLRARFEVEERGGINLLVGEADLAAPAQLGRATPFVGRDRLMGRLMELADECFVERLPRAIVVTGNPGVGKSRVRHEFLARLSELEPEPIVWFARGDEMRRGVPMHMLRQMLGRAFLAEVEDREQQRAALRDSLVELMPIDKVSAVEPFLAEAIELAGDDDLEVQAARANPEVLHARIRQAFTELVEAVTRRAPLVLVIEDIHNGDVASFRVFEAAMRRSDTPLLVLCFGRPRARELLPLLQTDWDMTITRIRGLRADHAEALARRVLGDRATDPVVARIVNLADGNPLQLEELLRATLEQDLAEGELPASLATVLSSRLERLDPKLRAVLRAACIFGETFVADGVNSLLGAGWSEEALKASLDSLVRAEIIRPLGTNRESEAHGYRFRQSLLRDAAYASLSADDRATGHGLAAEFEVARGAPEPDVLAHHLIAAGRTGDATKQLLRAAREAWDANAAAAALVRVQRALEIGTEDAVKGPLLALAGRAHFKLGELEPAEQRCTEALSLLPERGHAWWAALAQRANARTMRRAPESVADAKALAEAPDEVLQSPVLATALSETTFHLINNGPADVAKALGDRMESAYGGRAEAWAVAPLCSIRARRAYTNGDLAEHLRNSQRSFAAYEELGEQGHAAWQLVATAFGETELGRFGRAISLLSRARRLAEEASDEYTLRHAELQLASASSRIGEVRPAIPLLKKALEEATQKNDIFTMRVARGYLAFALWRSGQRAEATELARMNIEGVGPEAVAAVFAGGILSSILIEEGRHAEAIEVATRMISAKRNDAGSGEGLARLALFRALDAAENETAANEALAAARDRLLERADRISDESVRQSFLEEVEPHALTLLEAKRRLG